jgi:protocatechuate 3,4-dioxygenase beta subunit
VLLDEEIARLPDALRAPFVLCCLENHSRAEAAQHLGIQESTLRMRLHRARKSLQTRLQRRGVSLTAALAALALAPKTSAAVPRSLTGPIVKAATHLSAGQTPPDGLVSDLVLTLVKGVNQAMFISKCKWAILLLLCTLAAAGLGLAAPRGPRAGPTTGEAARKEADGRKPKPDAASETKAKEVIEVRGLVLDPDGRPVAGAKLYLRSGEKEAMYPLHATSGGDGRFAFRYPLSRAPRRELKVLAVGKGYGCAWEPVGPADRELTLRLVKDAAVSGRIVDADGKAVANAKLTVDGVAAFTGANKSGIVFTHTLPYTDYPWDPANSWLGPLPDQGIVLTTSADGRFKLTGVGPNRIVSLHLEAPGIATSDLGVVSGTPVLHVAGLSRSIRGVVRDKASGKPLAGASVFVSWWPDFFYEEPRWGKAVTDKEGRYELLGLPRPARYQLRVKPARGQLYFQREVELGDAAGLAAQIADIDMVRGVTVRGKVTDKATHKPIARARVVYIALWGNASVSREAQCSAATTGPDGSYALTVHPGPGVLGVVCPNPDAYMPALVTAKEIDDFFTFTLPWRNDEECLHTSLGYGAHPLTQADYNALVLLEPREDDKALVKDIALERALVRKGRIVGPDNQPISGVTVFGLSPGLAGYQQLNQTLDGADFTVRGINPRRKRVIIFQHKGKNLGYCLKGLPDEKAGPLTIKLQACGSISGRIVDPDGVPVTSERIYVHSGYGWVGALGPLTFDREGRFHVKGLVPGMEFRINDKKRPVILRNGIVVEAGKDRDLGDIRISDN